MGWYRGAAGDGYGAKGERKKRGSAVTDEEVIWTDRWLIFPEPDRKEGVGLRWGLSRVTQMEIPQN
jgi:hypothetical protein